MYYTETEIMSQHEALQKTFDYMKQKNKQLEAFFETNPYRKFVFLGCGSSYMLAKSAQKLFTSHEETTALAIAGGDFLINSTAYEQYLNGSIVVCISRSGKTSEIVRSAAYIKSKFECPIISIVMEPENDLSRYCDLELVMEWCFDKSVCQTRTVTNLYTALVLLFAYYAKDGCMEASVKTAIEENNQYKDKYRNMLREVAGRDWDNAVVLADGAVCGIAEEGALAFAEIARVSGCYANVLDYRHGPMVLNKANTLNIVLLQPQQEELQRQMIEDLKKRKGIVVSVSQNEENIWGSDYHINIGNSKDFPAWGIPFIYIMQMTAYEKAIAKGCNPDVPEGLDAYIQL